MRRRYTGRTMTIYGSLLPGAATIARHAAITDQLTERARYKIKVWDWHRNHGSNVSLTARHFGLGRATLHRWLKEYNRIGLLGFNEKSRRPKRWRRPTTSPEIILYVATIRKNYPAWSKYKIRRMLHRDHGIAVSASTVGRILKRRGFIDKKKSAKRRTAALAPRQRFPHGFKVSCPGAMVQMDTKYIMLPGGRKLYQFTAIDVLSKRRVLRVYPSRSSRNGRLFLEECIRCFPFTIKAVQTDNGGEFLKEFEKRCVELRIPHYYIYPRTPKQNSYVERSHGSDQEEFYLRGNVHQDREAMNRKIQEWEDVWNNIRPHEALDYRTPNEYLAYLQSTQLPTNKVIILQT